MKFSVVLPNVSKVLEGGNSFKTSFKKIAEIGSSGQDHCRANRFLSVQIGSVFNLYVLLVFMK